MSFITYQYTKKDENDSGLDWDYIELTFPDGHNLFIKIKEHKIELHATGALVPENKAVNLLIIKRE